MAYVIVLLVNLMLSKEDRILISLYFLKERKLMEKFQAKIPVSCDEQLLLQSNYSRLRAIATPCHNCKQAKNTDSHKKPLDTDFTVQSRK